MPPIPEPPNLLHFDLDDESLILLQHPATLKRYSSFEESSASLSLGGGNGEAATATSPSSGLSRIWSSYYDALIRRPVLVKSVTALFLMILADMSAQGVERLRGVHHMHGTSARPIDWLRALRFGVFGLIGAPWTHYYYYWLDTVLPPTQEPWTWTTASKVFIDQFIQAPVMLTLIVSGLAFMEGLGWDGIVLDMHHQYIPALLNNWTLWVPATIVNIAFVPPALRVLYDNLVFFFWTIYLSMVLNK